MSFNSRFLNRLAVVQVLVFVATVVFFVVAINCRASNDAQRIATESAPAVPVPVPLLKTAEKPLEESLLTTAAPTWSVDFSPKGGCQDAIVKFIGTAHKTVRLSAYSFTSQPIADALIARQVAGANVQVVLDRSDVGPTAAANSRAGALLAAHVPVWIDAKHAIMHDKYIIVDDKAIETGSYNYTGQAETSNAENCFFFHNVSAAAAFTDNWNLHQSHSPAFTGTAPKKGK